ncbi:hypothetical protein NEOLEDRAFT_1139285 [Neolentinus lepideus HHB14362 ss-1]|uniref:3-oxo-5-alpha-steroid 4-dehydrogenase C-terminal domain-containing protein n=1 Tax=Neolentinus lepideus HHB14362 ss-1 TaxID=1314782 RepID=A0A165PT48_9AGAM|nr:hypothetical protein NEOLEDRAFT_1139285 [Neolentinus lepideus HHB14362 ss-1]
MFMVDGLTSWILMEAISPIFFLYTYYISPLTPASQSRPLSDAATPFAIMYLLHYSNRTFLTPLRTPSRSKSHLIVPLAAILFNIVNGSLLGTYLSSPQTSASIASEPKWRLYAGTAMWLVGIIGNIKHDEILLNIRRDKTRSNEQNHYAIPHGLLYKYISYPNYFCEWIEWIGFAVACSPVPSLLSYNDFLRTVTPPWLFVIAEVATMLPRAWRGHKWYHQKFPEYPKERKAVIPFIF